MIKTLRKLALVLGLAPPLVCAYPAYDLLMPNGSQLHLVGSIHMGTKAMSPLPVTLMERLKQADGIIVEVDISKPVNFNNRNDYPHLSERLSESEYLELTKISQQLKLDIKHIATESGWQAALVLQNAQAQQFGLQGDYGIDYQVIQAANQYDIQIIELEGAQKQLDLLEQLPNNGMPLLQDSLMHWQDNEQLMQTMIGWWQNQHPNNQPLSLPYGMEGDLYDLMVANRNRQWVQQLLALPKGEYVVVVGALHLFGEHNLLQLLKENTGVTGYDNATPL
ncbi:TraB/GumN family protein [Jinshanibacter sp. LJY008]|uniref:TraB/GumN family protein n=1 Tax=Limnobaculum eriocheiris TaxID=2897391 RepID=A0A9X1MYG6_9GAMM|nr:TraB/GumN family protein [Limnobaculum eriocheiris]MCD1126940.1 TraB/GumN family protein [Limnobaculum eriocheiris]